MKSRKKIKQTASALLCALFIFLTPVLFSSCRKTSAEDFIFAPVEGGYKITSVTVLRDDVRLPDSCNGQPVVAIGDQAFYRNGTIRSLEIPNSYKFIGESAFAGCERLKRVTFDAGGSCEIGESAFADCALLEKVEFSSSVWSIGESSFSGCKNLGRLKLDETLLNIGRDAFRNCEQLVIDAPEGSYAYEYAKNDPQLSTSFAETDKPAYILIAGAVALGVGFSVFLRIHDKKKARKAQEEALKNSACAEKNGESSEKDENDQNDT